MHSNPWAAHMDDDPIELPPGPDTSALPELGAGLKSKWGQRGGGALGGAQAKRSVAMENATGAFRRNSGGSGSGGGGSASQARRGRGGAEFGNQLGFNPPSSPFDGNNGSGPDHPRFEKAPKPTSPLIGQHRAASPPSVNLKTDPSTASFGTTGSELSELSKLKRGVPSPPQGARRAPGFTRVASQGQHQFAALSAPPGPAADFGAAPMAPPAYRSFSVRRSFGGKGFGAAMGGGAGMPRPGRSGPGRGDRGAAAAAGASLFGVGL